jgi:hypothetical protein
MKVHHQFLLDSILRNSVIQSHMMKYLINQQHICLVGQNTLMMLMFARGSIVVDPWRGCNKKEGVTVYHYGDTRNNPLGLVDLYNGRVYEDEDIN